MHKAMEDRLRVLVVNDTVTYRTIVSRILADVPGVEVVGVAANGKIALQKVEQLRPDVLTLDVEMPEMDGLEVLRRLRVMGLGIGVVMLSGLTAAGAKATLQALELGAFEFVVKPSGSDSRANADRLREELRLKMEAFSKARKDPPESSGLRGTAAGPNGRAGGPNSSPRRNIVASRDWIARRGDSCAA